MWHGMVDEGGGAGGVWGGDGAGEGGEAGGGGGGVFLCFEGCVFDGGGGYE